MSSRIGAGEAAAPGGIFDRLGNFVVRWPLLVIAAWIAVAAVLALTLPPLPAQAAKHDQKPLPDDAPTSITAQQMGKAFGELGAGPGSTLMVVLTDEKGISPADEDVYRKLVDKLHQDTQDKLSVQDFVGTPQMRELLASKDGKAFILPVTIPGATTAPSTLAAFYRVKQIISQTSAGTTLTAHVSGPAAIVVDATAMAEEDLHFIEIATVLSVLIILFVIYRNVVTMFVPLLNIGASLATSQGVLSGLAELGLPVNMQTLVLMSAVMIGAGTDYAVFLISRYHDYVRHGQDSDQAVKNAMMSIGKVVAASGSHRRSYLPRDDLHQTGSIFSGGSGNFNFGPGGVAVFVDAAARRARTRRTTWLDQAPSRVDHSFVAGYGNAGCAPTTHPSSRQSDRAHQPGCLHERDALQLRRSQDNAGFGRQLQGI